MAISYINSDTTIVWGNPFYLIDASANNVNITVSLMANDFEFYNIVRVDSSSNIVSVILSGSSLMTGETSFNLAPLSNVSIMSNNQQWIPVNGYTANR
jgi:hypothetical protein